MPSYFPENNDPKPMDSADRSLQKINSLLGNAIPSTSGLKIANGLGGGRYIGGTTSNAGNWYAIQAVTDTKFHTLTGNITGVANTALGSAIEIPAGLVMFGSFTTIQLHSGSVIAYNA
jgi:hypothetical protein